MNLSATMQGVHAHHFDRGPVPIDPPKAVVDSMLDTKTGRIHFANMGPLAPEPHAALAVVLALVGMRGTMMLTDEQWAVLGPLIERCRPHAKVPPSNLRRTIDAILWRHGNGAKWRSIPAELGPWWMAAQTFIRWSRLGVWERLLRLIQEQGVQLGMTFLDGTSVRAHHKAAGAAAKGATRRDGAHLRRLAVLVAAMARKPA